MIIFFELLAFSDKKLLVQHKKINLLHFKKKDLMLNNSKPSENSNKSQSVLLIDDSTDVLAIHKIVKSLQLKVARKPSRF